MEMNIMSRQVDIDFGSVPSEEEYEGKLVIVLSDQERREPVFLGDIYISIALYYISLGN